MKSLLLGDKKKNDSLKIAQYTSRDKAEDKLLLRAIQKGELGKVPQSQIDALINRINGIRLGV